jgi:hypothetical protein
MAEHKFKIGQLVYIHPKPLLAPRGPYKVIDRLQAPELGFQYLIRSEDGLHECIVRESELWALDPAAVSRGREVPTRGRE